MPIQANRQVPPKPAVNHKMHKGHKIRAFGSGQFRKFLCFLCLVWLRAILP